jgi:VIT1/CCC1 family predicted Fe2+/Mn2+ transporter
MHPVHRERHFTGKDVLRDVVIGVSDGLTVPFALAAGLSGAVDSNHIIIVAGLAEIAAGSISMGLGGYLAAKGDVEHYVSERAREEQEIVDKPEAEVQEVVTILKSYGLESAESHGVAEALKKRPKDWVDFMMRFELGLEQPNPGRALISALTIGGSYLLGGLIPLSPYILASTPRRGLAMSAGLTAVALMAFGLIKGRFTGISPRRGAMQTLVIGGLAAAAAYLIARWIS